MCVFLFTYEHAIYRHSRSQSFKPLNWPSIGTRTLPSFRLIGRSLRPRSNFPTWSHLDSKSCVALHISSPSAKGGETFVQGYLQSEIVQSRDE